MQSEDIKSPLSNNNSESRHSIQSDPEDSPTVNDKVNTPWSPTPLSAKLGTGSMKNLSKKLMKFMKDYEESVIKLKKKYNNDVLLFDSVFESGNLL